MFVAEDDDGALYTAEELRVAVLQAFADPEEGDFLAEAWTEVEPDHPGTGWTENLGLLVSLIHPARAERIRRVLGYAPTDFAEQLDAVRRSLPWGPPPPVRAD